MTSAAPKTVFIVSHTHWDREWYLTYHQFRAKLAGVMERVLAVLEEVGPFRHFLLDGQSILLEDYLAVHPEDAPRLTKLAVDGALAVGPWYVLADEFLVSGEALVRNLVVGHQVAGETGPVLGVGYVPDSFGHIAQMPQILRRAGIDSFVYTRGNGDEIDSLGLEYLWAAPDGSTVLAINQCAGYCNGGALGLERGVEASSNREIDPVLAVNQVQALFAKMAERSRGDVYLLSNGCDHEPPQREFSSILDALRAAFPNTEFRHAALQDYVDAVRDAGFAEQPFTGELRGGRLHHSLSGVWSSRTYLKQLNERTQNLLSRYAEPLSAYFHFDVGVPYPHGEIMYAWKLLLQNHPHDSICGCSTDAVHRDMVPRFDGAVQTAESIIQRGLERLVPRLARRREDDGQVVLGIANPLPVRRTELVERVVVLPATVPADSLWIENENGDAVPFTVVERQCPEPVWGMDYRAELFADRQLDTLREYLAAIEGQPDAPRDQDTGAECFVTIQFAASDLPALGHANYFVRAGQRRESSPVNTAAPVGAVTVSGDSLENEFCRVELHPDGTFDLLDKATGVRFTSLNRLEDTEDVGDEYDYSPCERSDTISASGVDGVIRATEDTGFRGRLEARLILQLPAAIARSRRERTRRTVDCAVICRVGLSWNSPVVDIELSFDNRAKDHRLRAVFPTPVQTDTIVSDGHFFLNHRAIDQPSGEGWLQPPSGTFPQQDFSLVQDGTCGLAVLNRGLTEVAPFRTPSGAGLHVTLLRAVGWLSRGDFPTRGYTAVGPTVPTPDAQCLCAQRFRYAVVPFAGDFSRLTSRG